MPTEAAVDELSLTDQTVLLGVAVLDRDDETPVRTPELRAVCKARLSSIERVVGTLDEADVMRSLYRLEDEGVVEEVPESQTSPTGKGRPAYSPVWDPDTIFEAVEDELVEGLDSTSGA